MARSALQITREKMQEENTIAENVEKKTTER
jgi:hypothetical protein